MQFTDEIKKEILFYLAGDGPTPTGHACRFFAIGDIGVKVYDEECREKARGAYANQKRAHALGLGPAVGDEWTLRIRAGSGSTFYLYGYLTEVAQVYRDDGRETLSDVEFDTLTESLENAGFPTWDIYGRNVGRLKDGTPVCIDFDPVSMSENKNEENQRETLDAMTA